MLVDQFFVDANALLEVLHPVVLRAVSSAE
jgi:hypothetical protein